MAALSLEVEAARKFVCGARILAPIEERALERPVALRICMFANYT
jgi:hypothetical protein